MRSHWVSEEVFSVRTLAKRIQDSQRKHIQAIGSRLPYTGLFIALMGGYIRNYKFAKTERYYKFNLILGENVLWIKRHVIVCSV